MKKADMIKVIECAMRSEMEFATKMQGDRNPQIIEMVNLASGRAEAFEGVLHLLRTGSAGLL